MTELLPLLIAMLATGIAGGLLAGLLGVGGGIVIVPALEFAMSVLGVDPAIRMHIAVATSLATIIPTSIASARAHYRHDALNTTVIKHWWAAVFIGSAAGAVIASQLHSRVLSGIFAVVALLVAIKMMLPLDNKVIRDKVPEGYPSRAVPAAIGLISSMMGIGGGSMSVPTLTLFNEPIHRAVGTSAFIGLLIAIPGAIGFMFTGAGHPNLPPGSIGFVNLPGLLVIAPATILAAPWGAKLAHAMKRRHLSLLFGAFLLIVALRMINQAL